MKKVIYSLALAFTGLLALSCAQEHLDVVFDPSKVTGQTLGEIAGCALSEDGADITTTFNEADFGVSAPVAYTLFADLAGSDFANQKKIDATIAEGKIAFSQKKFNKTLTNLGAQPDSPVAVEFRLAAYLKNEKAANIESSVQYSNIVSANFTPYEDAQAELDVCDVPGDYQGWKPAEYPKLFNYANDGVIYRGVIDFGEEKKAGNGFKITYGGDWNNDTGNWGSSAQAEAAEAESMTLVNGDASQNIVCYSANRYYLFEFNKENLTLTKILGFDKVGVIGLGGDWDNDVEMTYNMYKGRFWADVDAASDTEFKFRLDGGWDHNWGGNMDGLSGGGDNIPLPAGQYRIYFYMNDVTMTAEVDASMYGQAEPEKETEPEPPVTYQGWGIIGVGGDWENDIAMTEEGGVWTGYATLAADDSWKIRKDAGWDENFGGTFTALGTPFEAVAGGDNIAVGAAGFFKIVYDSNAGTITVSDGNVWSLIGDFNEWAGDVDMALVDGKWVSPATSLTPGWKIRHNHAWDADRGGEFAALDTPFAAVAGGANIDCGTGDFIVTYDPAAETITVSVAFPANIWSVIGGFAASNWANDVKMTLHEGCMCNFWVSDPFEMKAGDEFKVRFNRDWGVNRGGDATLQEGQSVAVSQDGANIKAPADGTYTVVYCPEQEIIFFQGWSLIGSIGGTNWDTDFLMYPQYDEDAGTVWVSSDFKYEAGNEFKARYKADWGVNVGGTFSAFATPFDVTQDGANITLSDACYAVVMYAESLKMMSVCRADWGIIGDFNEWGGDVVMVEAEPGVYCAELTLASACGVKIRKNRAWDENRGGVMSALGTAFSVTNNGDNISLEAGHYFVEYDSNAETITVNAL